MIRLDLPYPITFSGEIIKSGEASVHCGIFMTIGDSGIDNPIFRNLVLFSCIGILPDYSGSANRTRIWSLSKRKYEYARGLMRVTQIRD
jgi:hypothetical protein